jgi:hypothetical protein
MNKILLFGLCLLLAACNDTPKAPDVSNVEMRVEGIRYDRSFFEIDSNQLFDELSNLTRTYPNFHADFMEQVLGLPADDTTADVRNNLLFFYQGYRPLFDTLQAQYSNTSDIEEAVQKGLQFVRYYFPSYPSKQKLIYFVGPFDAPGTALTRDGIAVGLQQYVGSNFSFYQSPQGMELFPTYISRRFERQYIPVNCLKLVVQELCPDTVGFGPLITQMVRRGREAWLLDQFLPLTPDTLKLGYTHDQLNWCEANESLIWSYFLKNIDPQSTDADIIQNFLGEAPFTAGLDQEHAPGNLGTWIGLQIVKAYVKKNPDATPKQVISMDPEKILEIAGYKPR